MATVPPDPVPDSPPNGAPRTITSDLQQAISGVAAKEQKIWIASVVNSGLVLGIIVAMGTFAAWVINQAEAKTMATERRVDALSGQVDKIDKRTEKIMFHLTGEKD